MLCEGNLPRYFWTEAMNTACYILNRVLTRPIIKKIPYEIWNERKPNIYYFHVFGCKCFVLNNGKDNLEKFDAKADEGIFLGYSTSSKAYRMFNKSSLIVEESIHVIFDESLTRKSKELKEEEETSNNSKKYNDNQNKQTRIDNEEENDKDEDLIESIHPSLPRDWRYANSHPKDQIIGDPSQGVRTRSKFRNLDNYLAFVSQIELKSIEEAECDSCRMVAMQEELNQFEKN